MSAVNDRNKTPEEIEREVEAARSDLRSTLGDIRDSLSPGQMLDQAIDYARDSGGGDFVRNLGRQVRDNPLPVALMGLGIGWLMTTDRSGHAPNGRRRVGGVDWVDPEHHHEHVDGPYVSPESGGRSTLSGARHAAGSAASGVSSAASSVAGGVSSAASSVADGVSSAASRVASGVSSAVHGVGSAVGGIAGSARSGASHARDQAYAAGSGANRRMHDARDQVSGYGRAAGGYAGDAWHYADDMAYRTRDGLARVAEQQPLLLGAAGLALGALIGALLPPTRTEDRTFGDAADRFKDEAGRMARDGYEQAAEAATEVADDTAKSLKERGVDTGAAKEALGTMADSVRSHANLGDGPNTAKDSSGSGSGSVPATGTKDATGTPGVAPKAPASPTQPVTR